MPFSHTVQNTVGQPQSYSLPASPTLQRLESEDIQAKAHACLTLLGAHPTDAQWEMILSSAVSTTVIAGAGSGKSTTLILRLLVLHKILHIPLEECHVFSFTKASTHAFQRKLAEQLLLWEARIEGKTVTKQRRQQIHHQMKRVVSTFHSVLARLRPTFLPGGGHSFRFFDIFGSSHAEKEIEAGSYHPFFNINLTSSQDEVLKAAHTAAYERFPAYQSVMKKLLEEQDRQQWLSGTYSFTQDEHSEAWKWRRLLEQERIYHGFTAEGNYDPSPQYHDSAGSSYVDCYRAVVADRLRTWNVPFVPLAHFPLKSPLPHGFPGRLYAAFQIGDALWLHIERCTAPKRLSKQDKELSSNQKCWYHERDRRRCILLYGDHIEHHKILGSKDFLLSGSPPTLSPEGELCLQQWLSTNGLMPPLQDAPVVRVQLPGDIHRQHIAELLYQEGLFLESLGHEVEHLSLQKETLDTVSAAIAEALPLFWHALQDELQKRGFIRFHDILLKFRDETALFSKQKQLSGLKHLFIDEFQDISPEIVDWLSKTLRVHAQCGEEVSLTAIGDDYQAIYGWRGSHPTFLLHIDQYFPAETAKRVILEQNFRSRQPIIDAAEAVMEPVPHQHKVNKYGKSAFAREGADRFDPVALVEIPLSWRQASPEEDIWHTFSTFVSQLLHDLETASLLSTLVEKRSTLTVFLLARTHSTLESIAGQLKEPLLEMLHRQGVTQFRDVDIQTMTFHSAKGLEADVLLLLDDSRPPEEHPLREQGFRQAVFLGQDAGTYQETMRDEAYRVAYVALTRARLGVMWIPLLDVAPQARYTHPTVSDQGCFVLVKKFLQRNGRG